MGINKKTKSQQWALNVKEKVFRSESSLQKYMHDNSNQNWRKIILPNEKIDVLFGNNSQEFYDFYESSHGQFCFSDGVGGMLFNVSFEEYFKNGPMIFTDDIPLLLDFLNKENLNDILSEAKCFFNVPDISNYDLKILNDWVCFQDNEIIRPGYFEERIFSYLLLIVGEKIINNFGDYCWVVLEKFVTNKTRQFPFLINKSNGRRIDINSIMMKYLFWGNGGDKKITSAFAGVKFEVQKDIQHKIKGSGHLISYV